MQHKSREATSFHIELNLENDETNSCVFRFSELHI